MGLIGRRERPNREHRFTQLTVVQLDTSKPSQLVICEIGRERDGLLAVEFLNAAGERRADSSIGIAAKS